MGRWETIAGDPPQGRNLDLSVTGSPFSVSGLRCLNASEPCALDADSGEGNKQTSTKKPLLLALTA